MSLKVGRVRLETCRKHRCEFIQKVSNQKKRGERSEVWFDALFAGKRELYMLSGRI